MAAGWSHLFLDGACPLPVLSVGQRIIRLVLVVHMQEHGRIRWWIEMGLIAGTVATAVVYLESLERDMRSLQAETVNLYEIIQADTVSLHQMIRERAQEERDWDADWIQSDLDDHNDIVTAVNSIRSNIVVLQTMIKTNPGFMYEIGLRDGRDTCPVM